MLALRDIEPALDDGGRQQHVELAVDELPHGVLDGGRRQPAVRHGRRISGTIFAQVAGDRAKSSMRGQT